MQGVAPTAELFVDMSVLRTVCCKGFTAVVWKMGDECESVFCLFFLVFFKNSLLRKDMDEHLCK